MIDKYYRKKKLFEELITFLSLFLIKYLINESSEKNSCVMERFL